MAEWLTPRTPDLVVWGSALARRFVSLNKELLFNTPVCLSSCSVCLSSCSGLPLITDSFLHLKGLP